MTRFVFVTGGVVSSLGKGIASASLGAILEARGLKVAMVKLDPYINVDPGTMSPFQHGEVFVTQDGTRPISTSAITSVSCAPPPGATAISPPGASTSASSPRSAAAITSAPLCRSSAHHR